MLLAPGPDTTPQAAPFPVEVLGDAERLAVLAATGLLDSPPEEAFDRLTRLAAEFLDAPLAQVNLVDDHRQFSKSSVVPDGWPEDPNTLLADCYCKWAVAERAPIVVTDARTDPRTCDTGTSNVSSPRRTRHCWSGAGLGTAAPGSAWRRPSNGRTDEIELFSPASRSDG